MARVKLKRILVGIEFPSERRQLALKRAAQLAHRTGARLILFHSAFAPTPLGSQVLATFERTVKTVVAERKAALQKLAAPLRRQGLKVSIKTGWDYPAHEGIVREVLRSKPDLVVAESRRHGFGARLLLTNTDWQLIRLCPAPLLFVKQTRAYGKTRVVAAIDPLHDNAKAAGLDARILETAQAVAAAHSGRLDVIHAYLPLAAASVFLNPMVASMSPAVEEQYENNIRRALERSVAAIDLPSQQLHMVMGTTYSAIPDAAKRLRADVLVMGAISRRGLKRLFIGSTAERTIDRAHCDVLVVKQRGFKTPVPRRPTTGQRLQLGLTPPPDMISVLYESR